MSYIKVSVPRPEGNPGKGIMPKDVLTLIDVDDILSFPSRDENGVVLAGDIVPKAGAYATTIYFTPGTVEITSNGEGDPDAKGFTPVIKGKHPGNKQAIREFKTNWLGRHCIAILSYANGDPADCAGSPTNPMDMGVAYTGNKDSNSSEFTFTQIGKGDDIAIYAGTIPTEEPLSTVAEGVTAIPYVGPGQYQLTGGATVVNILSMTGSLVHGALITLLGVESGVAPTVALAAESLFILKDGKTFTASNRSQITFKIFKDGANTFKLIEQSRYEA